MSPKTKTIILEIQGITVVLVGYHMDYPVPGHDTSNC